MDSHQVLQKAIEKVGAKKVAGDMNISPSLVYKWCQPSATGDSTIEPSGARNPLDRLVALLESTNDTDVVQWLCEQAGGFFVHDPEVSDRRIDVEYIANTQRIIEDFSRLLRALSDAITDDGEVDENESQKIRTQWQRLKRYGEAFVCACERGMFTET
ncbi:MAG: phage regulatory CII family protein [Planctomycetota bacterium]|nr:phage regulatory CII family protein [Planctomycetota bacterium]